MTETKRKSISVGLIVTTFLGMAISITFFLPTVSSAHLIFVDVYQLFIPTDLWLLLGFIFIPIVYCSFASILIHPKSMVSPILVQVGTIALVIIFTVMNLSLGVGILTVQRTVALIGLLAFSMAFVILIGFFQWIVVYWVVRMVYEDSDRVSYIIDMKPKVLLHKLGDAFLDVWIFTRECDVGEFWVLERSDSNYRCLLLEVGAHPDDENKCVLATIAYEIIGSFIVKSDSASSIRDTVIDDIVKRIGVDFRKNTTDLNDSVSKLAFVNVESYGRSRIEVTWAFLRKLPKLFKAMLGLTLTLLLGLTVVYFNFNEPTIISSDTFLGAFVVLVVALFVEIGIPLRDELQKRKREEIEF